MHQRSASLLPSALVSRAARSAGLHDSRDPLADHDSTTRQTLLFDDNVVAAALYGAEDRHLKILERDLAIEARGRGNEVRLVGPAAGVAVAKQVLEELYGVLRDGRTISARDVDEAVRMLSEAPDTDLNRVYEDVLGDVGAKRRIAAKTLAQRRYVDAMHKHDLVFAVGPAGTGKTYLAMAMAIAALNRHEVSRVVLTRPAVEAGEKLGFLPGSLTEKVDPYLRPLFDALSDMMDYEKSNRLMERNIIEVAPLAFMRGRTLNDAFVILDEAQNTTSEQMKMFLTRLGYESRAVVTGDITQVDLPAGRTSGLVEAIHVLNGVDGIAFREFSDRDVVRHPLVQSIIRAYEHRSATDSGSVGDESVSGSDSE